MGEYFRSQDEFFDLVNLARSMRGRGAHRMLVHGSTVKGRGPEHGDIDFYVEYEPDVARRIGCYGLGDLDFMRVEKGSRSGEKFDIRESNVPFEQSAVGYKGQLKRVVFGPKEQVRESWE
jgi:hypothetical protein